MGKQSDFRTNPGKNRFSQSAFISIPSPTAISILPFRKPFIITSAARFTSIPLPMFLSVRPNSLPSPEAPFITIPGTQKNKGGYFQVFAFLAGNNDGLVSKNSTQLDTEERHYSLPISHFKIMHQEKVQKIIIDYFKTP